MADVFSRNGIKVHLANTDSPIPCIIYETMQRKLDIGVMMTASHNQAIYNGVKLFTKGGYDADVSFTDEIERECERLSKAKRKKHEKNFLYLLSTLLKTTSIFLPPSGRGL